MVVVVALVTTLSVGEGYAGAAVPHTPVVYLPPVDGTVVDEFRPPAQLFGPGNRGLEYATAVGVSVRASAPGEVVFAGPVAGSLHVTIAHPDQRRTSYSFLASVQVAVGMSVTAGTPVGTSTGRLHFGVREGERYVDPAALLAVPRYQAHLVPDPVVQPGRHAEGLALLPVALQAGLSGLRGQLAPITPLAHYAVELSAPVRAARVSRRFLAWWSHRDECTPPATPAAPPTERRIVVLVGGLGTTSERSSVDRVDIDALGYADADVVRFSYVGGRTPEHPPSGPLTALAESTYDSQDSQQDLLVSARHLQALLVDIATRQPGVPIDVIAHSQGGVVAHLASSRLVGEADLPGEVDLVATLGTPHDGADLATAVNALNNTNHGPAALAVLGERLDLGLAPPSASVAQLSETSDLMDDLAEQPPPVGLRLLTIGARGDLTVPAGHTYRPGAAHHTIGLQGGDAHTLLPGDPAATRELALALRGRPPTCETALDVLADLGTSEGISYAEDLAGFTAALLTS